MLHEAEHFEIFLVSTACQSMMMIVIQWPVDMTAGLGMLC